MEQLPATTPWFTEAFLKGRPGRWQLAHERPKWFAGGRWQIEQVLLTRLWLT